MKSLLAAGVLVFGVLLSGCCLERCGTVIWPAPRPAPPIPGAPVVSSCPACCYGSDGHACYPLP